MPPTPEDRERAAAALEGALLRNQTVRLLATRPRLTISEVDEAALKLGLSRAHLYRLLARFRQRPRSSTLAIRPRGRKTGSTLLSPQIELIVETVIQSFYLQQIKPSFAALVGQIQVDCHGAGLKAPDRKTIRRRVLALDEREITKHRQGPKVAREKYDAVSRSPAVIEALKRVQIDHTPVDLIVVDERDRRPIGRPWLTLAIDVASRMVCGFHLSMMPPSTISVAMALAHCVAPKDLWLADRELTFEWPVSGLPDLVYMDNAEEFQTEALRSTAEEYGFDLDYRPPGRPNFGGHIERLIGTMMGAVHLIPGTTFSSVAERGTYPSEKNAVMTLFELEQWFALQVHVYHSTIHSSLRRIPLMAWQDATAARDCPIRQIVDHQTFFLDLLPGERRKIRRDGIRLFNIHYWSNVLSPLAGRLSAPVIIKFDPRDLSSIYYRDEGGRYWTIPYRDLGAPPISLWEHHAAESVLRDRGKHTFNENDLFSAVLQQRKLIGASSSRTRRMRDAGLKRKGETPKRSETRGTEAEDDLEHTELRPFKVEELN